MEHLVDQPIGDDQLQHRASSDPLTRLNDSMSQAMKE
jgi:hypothetical protein